MTAYLFHCFTIIVVKIQVVIAILLTMERILNNSTLKKVHYVFYNFSLQRSPSTTTR